MVEENLFVKNLFSFLCFYGLCGGDARENLKNKGFACLAPGKIETSLEDDNSYRIIFYDENSKVLVFPCVSCVVFKFYFRSNCLILFSIF